MSKKLYELIRLRLLEPMELEPSKVYFNVMLVAPGGVTEGMQSGPAQLEVFNEDDGVWYNVPVVAAQPKRILTS